MNIRHDMHMVRTSPEFDNDNVVGVLVSLHMPRH